MKKYWKWFAALAITGAAIGAAVAFILKRTCNCNKENEDNKDLSDKEDFDLDSDLQPTTEREYVPLKKTGEETSAEAQEDIKKEENKNEKTAE